MLFFYLVSSPAFAIKWKLICDIDDYRSAKTNFNVRDYFPKRQSFLFDNEYLTVTQTILNQLKVNKISVGNFKNDFINKGNLEKGINWKVDILYNSESLKYSYYFFTKTGQVQVEVKTSKRIVGPIFGRCGTEPVDKPKVNLKPENNNKKKSLAENWLDENKWFSNNQEMRTFALKIHEQLLTKEGYKPNSKEYYDEINKRVRMRFESYFTKKQTSNLPKCPTSHQEKWHNCIGELKVTLGKYVGEFKNNKVSGQGKLFYDDGGLYDGEWLSNKFNGYGTLKTNGYVYRGQFLNDVVDGIGVMELSSGSKYDGQFKKGLFHGTGTYLWKNGNKYLGQFENGKRTGEGKFIFANGASYSGTFKNSKYDGYGVYTWKDGTTYTGEHKNGLANGFGTRKWSLNSKWSGDKYVGNFKDDKRHGSGKYIYKDGTIEKGTWINGVFTGDKKVQNNLVANIDKKSKQNSLTNNQDDKYFPLKPLTLSYAKSKINRDDIAVIIGNADYKKQSKDIPNVNPAYADAEGIKNFFLNALGVREGNIIYLRDATASDLLGVFGNEKSYKGKLFNYIKPSKSNVYVYYAGHGAPGDGSDAYLVPVNSQINTIKFTGYPLSTLYSNLGKLPAKSVTVILEACFSGGSQSGSLISKASPIIITPEKTMIPDNVKVIAAGASDQMASWEEDSSHSLFTKYFLKAMSGEGDVNKDGKVSDNELKEYLSDTMTYYARRYYGRDQKVQIHNGG